MAKITTRKQRDRIVNKLQNKETVWLLTPRTTTRWGGKIGEDIYNPGLRGCLAQLKRLII